MRARSPHRLFRILSCALLAGSLAATLVGAARADKLPEPPEPFRDYQGTGLFVVDVPAGEPAVQEKGGEKQIVPSISFMLELQQSYVRPDRILIERSGQVTLVQDNIEIDFSPAVGYIIERVYKNLGDAPQNPILAVQLSMSTYARLLPELKSARLLPDEDLEKLEAAQRARITALQAERVKLTSPTDLPRYNSLSVEMARLRNDLDQIPYRKTHPCHLVEVDNQELVRTLFAKGLVGDRDINLLLKGKTVFKITKNEGLPVRFDTTDNDGHVVLSFCFTRLKINTGLRNNDLVLRAPAGTRRVSAMADLKDAHWEEKMDKELGRQIKEVEKERRPKPQGRPGLK